MTFLAIVRLRFLRLALFAALLNALAPAVSYALTASRPQIPIDVCATHGGAAFAATVALLAQQQDEHAAHDWTRHCGACVVHGHGGQHHLPGLPSSSVRTPQPQSTHERPSASSFAAHASAPLTGPQARGPPVFA